MVYIHWQDEVCVASSPIHVYRKANSFAKDGFLLHIPYVPYKELPYLFVPLFFQTKDIDGANWPLTDLYSLSFHL